MFSKLVKGSNVSALVVEDSTESLELLSAFLERVGLKVLLSTNGQEAMDLLRRSEQLPDIIFIDIKMPLMDGPTLLTHLQADFGDKCPPCVAVSAHAMPNDIKYYSQLGFDAYITKPIKFSAITDALEQLLSLAFETIEHNESNKQETVDFEQLKIPRHYLQRLKEVVADYEITLLEECMSELIEHCEQGKLISDCIRPYLNNYDMDGLLQALNKVASDNG